MLEEVEKMDALYVHLDTTSNAVLASGLTHFDFISSVIHQPQNLLFVDPATEFGEYENHTGFKLLREADTVIDFFHSLNHSTKQLKWIDFSDVALIKELTPLEISELLYFGHTSTHLHSPFFYKLQNNFAYFDVGENLTRVYYRYLEEFYRVLADKISRITLSKTNQKKGIFRKSTPINKLPADLIKELKSILQEGIVFSFQQAELIEQAYHIPIYVIEDALWKTKSQRFQNEPLLATLSYHTETQTWHLEKDINDLLFAK